MQRQTQNAIATHGRLSVIIDLLGFAQAFDQRRAQQELARQRRVFGRAPQLVVVALAHGGVALLEQPLVADGLRLGVLHGDVAALALVAVELGFVDFAAQDAGQLVGEVEGVVHAAVEPHAADRAVHVGASPARMPRPTRNFFATRWCTA